VSKKTHRQKMNRDTYGTFDRSNVHAYQK